MYTVQTDNRTITFGPDTSQRSWGDWPIFTFTPEQAKALAAALRRAAASVRWNRAAAFAVGELTPDDTSPLYHLATPADSREVLQTAALCGHQPSASVNNHPAWTSVRPLAKINQGDPNLCPHCLTQWRRSRS